MSAPVNVSFSLMACVTGNSIILCAGEASHFVQSGRRFIRFLLFLLLLFKWVSFTSIFSIAESPNLGVLDGGFNDLTSDNFIDLHRPKMLKMWSGKCGREGRNWRPADYSKGMDAAGKLTLQILEQTGESEISGNLLMENCRIRFTATVIGRWAPGIGERTETKRALL